MDEGMRIQGRIRKILKGIKPDRNINIEVSADLFNMGILDSFGMIEYLSALEKEFGVKIVDEDLIPQNFWNIEASVQLVRKYLQQPTDRH